MHPPSLPHLSITWDIIHLAGRRKHWRRKNLETCLQWDLNCLRFCLVDSYKILVFSYPIIKMTSPFNQLYFKQTMCHKVVASFKYCWDLIWFCQVRVVGNLIKVKLIMEVAGLVVVPWDNSKDVKGNQQYPSLQLIERTKFHPNSPAHVKMLKE